MLSCCAAAGFMACNETVDWTYTEKCEDGAEQCHENTVRRCVDGEWDVVEKCEGDKPVCDSTSHTCVATPILGCTTGETKCEGNKLFTCENAIWNEGVECTGDTPICGTDESNVAACIADTTVKCVNGDDEYEVGDGYCDASGVAQVCGEDGEFEAATNCAGRICEVNENHVAACRDGEKCVVNEETGETVEHNALYCDTNGNVAKCDDGTGRVDTACKAPEVCENASKTCQEPKSEDCMYDGSLIANGSTVCKENGKVTCKDGNLSNVDKCTTDVENATAICTMDENVATCGYQCNEGYIEEDGKCVEKVECEEGTYKCDPTASTYSVCYWGGWQDQGSCENFQYSSSSSSLGTAFACNDANDGCIITACEDGYEPTKDGDGCQEKPVTNNCKNDLNGNKPALNSYYCIDENTSALCQADGSTALETACESTFKCNPSTVNTLGACGCTEATANSCKDAKQFTCDPATGEYKSVACANPSYSDAVCSEDNLTCDFKCKYNYVKNADNTGCVQCNTDEQCASRADGKTTCDTATNKCIAPATPAECTKDEDCASRTDGKTTCDTATNKCIEPATPAECTQSVCNGVQYKECKDGKFQAEITCTTGVEHATAICTETMGCSFACDARYTLVDGKCELIDGGCLSDADCKGNAEGKTTCDTKTGECIMPATPAECTENDIMCDGNVVKMCVDGKWGEVETCTDDKPICSVKAEGCIQCNADSDCGTRDDGKTTCNTETNTCVAPATPSTECTKDEDCASREDDKTTCDTKTNTCEKAWETIVVADSFDGTNPSCQGVPKSTGSSFLNCGNFAKGFDPSKAYIVYELDASAIASLAGKSQIAADFGTGTQASSKTKLKKANYQFFAGNTALGTVGTVALNGDKPVSVEKYSVSITSTENLQLRVWPDPSEAAGSASFLRLYPTTIYAR